MLVDLIVVGFGHVARRFVRLLIEKETELERRHRLTTRVIGIATRRHGCAYGDGGLDAASLATRVEAGDSLGNANSRRSTVEFVADAVRSAAASAADRRLVVVETTTLDIVSGEPACSHIRAALAGGAHVVTTNKGPIAFAYRELADLAARAGRRLLFEGTVMDGIPVFNLARESLPGVTVLGFRGVVNSTTNHMLTAMERGQSFGHALSEMQRAGIAEADASLDVDGWDAAAKTAALANVLLDAGMTPREVEREGITPDTGPRAVDARSRGRRLKLVASARRENGRVAARVAPEELAAEDLLAGLDGRQNALILQTDLLDEIAIVQRGGSLTHTAYALVADLVSLSTTATSDPQR